jgi:hypothetical protein
LQLAESVTEDGVEVVRFDSGVGHDDGRDGIVSPYVGGVAWV